MPYLFERLAEYGRKPHRYVFAQTTYHGPQYTDMWLKLRGVRFHRIRNFKQN